MPEGGRVYTTLPSNCLLDFNSVFYSIYARAYAYCHPSEACKRKINKGLNVYRVEYVQVALKLVYVLKFFSRVLCSPTFLA
jgi:hypothetical protein